MSMAATSPTHRWKYDVFVSFRGTDIRKSFIDHLFKDFEQKGINAFRDDSKLPKGEEISYELYNAIEGSRFLIVIFTKNYADSSWCLRELVKILECKRLGKPKHEVQIIFYDVKPNVVRKQTESYAQAISKHESSNKAEVASWKKALSMAGDLSGFDLEDLTNGYESKFIDSISKEILIKLCDGPLYVGEKLVGIDIHLHRLKLFRFIGSDRVQMIGICGISGIGKTTLAKAMYNLMYIHFEGSCFCEDVQGVTKRQGLTQVQMQLIDEIMKTSNAKISSVSQGSMLIKKRFSSKRILLVLDDVDHREQLEALVGSRNWFSPGSLIIFTCKDKQLLNSHRVDEIHDVGILDKVQSLQLFSSHAFDPEEHPTVDFIDLASQFVQYIHGHPLALKVLGCFLYGKNVSEWKSELDRLKVAPNAEVHQVLRLSYDGLDSDQQKILLDIACSFIGEKKDLVASVLDSCNFYAITIMRVLVDKSLITISINSSVQMHELIQAMAKEIVRKESDRPEERSRLWIPSEVYHVLSENKAAEAVEVIDLWIRKSSKEVHIQGKAFAYMKNLRILKLPHDSNVSFSGRLEYLSNKLSYLRWHGCPFKFLPSDFYPGNIVAIDLSYSHIKHIWTKPECFQRLKSMKLSHCPNLTSSPNFTEITNLEELNLEGCVNLVELHPSIGMLKKLVVLNMENCKRLQNFPHTVEMDSLQVLILSGCERLKLHNDRHEMVRSKSMWWPSISRPFSLLSKQHPQGLVLSSLSGLHLLRNVDFSYCDMLEVPDSIGSLSSLEYLKLKGNKFTSLPGSLNQLSRLVILTIDGCKKLEVLPELPPRLSELYASDCTSLRELPGLSNHPRLGCYIKDCPKLFTNDSHVSLLQTPLLDSSVTSHGSRNQLSYWLKYMSIQISKSGIFQAQEVDGRGIELDISYRGNNIPQWYTNQSMGNHLKVTLPTDWCYSKFRGYVVCAVFSPKKSDNNTSALDVYNNPQYKPQCYMNNFDGASLGNTNLVDGPDFPGSVWIWLHHSSLHNSRWKEAKNFVTFSFTDVVDAEVKECGVRLVFDEDIQQETDLLEVLPTPTSGGGSFLLRRADGTTSWYW